MEKMFLEPEVTVVRLGNNDVICTSIFGCGTESNETGVRGVPFPGILGFH